MPTEVEKLEAKQAKLQAGKDAFLNKHRAEALKVKLALDAVRAADEAATLIEGLSDAQRQAVAAELAKMS